MNQVLGADLSYKRLAASLKSAAFATPVSISPGQNNPEQQLLVGAHEGSHLALMSTSIYGFIQGELYFRIDRHKDGGSPEFLMLDELSKNTLRASIRVHEATAHYTELCEAARIGVPYGDELASRDELYGLPISSDCKALSRLFDPHFSSPHLRAYAAKAFARMCLNYQVIPEMLSTKGVVEFFDSYLTSTPVPDRLFERLINEIEEEGEKFIATIDYIKREYRKQGRRLCYPNRDFDRIDSNNEVPICKMAQRFSWSKKGMHKKSNKIRRLGRVFESVSYCALYSQFGYKYISHHPKAARSYIGAVLMPQIQQIDSFFMPRRIDKYDIWAD